MTKPMLLLTKNTGVRPATDCIATSCFVCIIKSIIFGKRSPKNSSSYIKNNSFPE